MTPSTESATATKNFESPIIGIEKLKAAVSLLAKLGTNLETDLQDGKFTIAEGISYITELPGLFNVAKDYKELGNQWADLTPEELVELIEFAKSEYKTDNEHAEQIIDSSIEIIAHIGYAVTAIFDLASLIKDQD